MPAIIKRKTKEKKHRCIYPWWNSYITDASQVGDFIERTLETLKYDVKVKASRYDPSILVNRIKIFIENPRELTRSYGKEDDKIRGFARNPKNDTKEAHIQEGYLWIIAPVIGHELGHVLTSHIDDTVIEEVKAYTFEKMWCDAIRRFNITNMRMNLMGMPIPQDMHYPHKDALELMYAQLGKGTPPRTLYRKVITGNLETLT